MLGLTVPTGFVLSWDLGRSVTSAASSDQHLRPPYRAEAQMVAVAAGNLGAGGATQGHGLNAIAEQQAPP